MTRPRFVVFVLLVVFGLCIYLPLLSTNYDLNGMAEAAALSSGRPVDLLLPNHMLYRPLGYAVQQAFAAAGVRTSSVLTLQVLSAIFGALGLGFAFLMLDRVIGDRAIAVWTTLILSISWSYWTMSTDIYYLSLSAMFVAAAMAVFVQARSDAAFTACGLLAGLAILSFQANVFLLPGLAAGIVLAIPPPDTRTAIRRMVLLGGAAAAVVGTAFVSVGILVYGRETLGDLFQWGSTYTGKALPMWGSWSSGRFLTVLGTSFKSILGMELWMYEFFHRYLEKGQVPEWIPVLGFLVTLAALIAAYRWKPVTQPGDNNRKVAWLVLLYLLYVPFFLWWDATEPRWFNISNIFLAGVVGIIASRWSSWPHFRFVLPAVFLILGCLNFAISAWPRRFAPSTPLRMAACVADQMQENDLFLATEWNWAGYLEHLHERDVLSFLGEVARTGDKTAASKSIAEAARERQRRGGNVYMIDVRTFPPEYTTWFNGQTGLTVDELLTFKGSRAFECVYSPFIRLDAL